MTSWPSLTRCCGSARTVPETPADRAPVSVGWMDQALAVYRKDLRVELRERTALASLVLFVLTSLVVVGFALTGGVMEPGVAASLLWVVMFFATFAGLGHTFVAEEETGTAAGLRLSACPEAILAGKLMMNLTLLAVVAVVAVPLFVAIAKLPVPAVGRLIAVVAGGVCGLASAATVIGALVAKARARGVLFGAIGFPIVLPLLMMTAVATRHAISPLAGDWMWLRDAGGLFSYATMLVAASVLVFPIIWESN